jgi:hypothetical protein
VNGFWGQITWGTTEAYSHEQANTKSRITLTLLSFWLGEIVIV